MKINQISQQNFEGKVNVLGELGSEQYEALEKIKPSLNSIIEKQDFDIFIKRNSFGETIVGTDLNSGYVVDSDNNFMKSALLSIRDKKNGSYLQRKMATIKNAISEIIL